MNDDNEQDHWLARPTTIRKLWWVFSAVLALTGGSAQTIHTDMIRLAFASRSVLAVAPMQDFLGLGSEARLNRPGTTRDNWRWRMAEDALDGALADGIRRMVEDASRAP